MYKQLKKKKWKFLAGGMSAYTPGIDNVTYGNNAPNDPIVIEELKRLAKEKIELEAKVAAQKKAEEEAGETEDPSKFLGASKFSGSDITAGLGQLSQSIGTAKLDDGKVTTDEVGSSLLDAGAAASGPYGQDANAIISVGEGLIGDAAYQGLGEGVEYEKGAMRAGKGALKGAALGAKVGGPIGAGVGFVGGAIVNTLGQGRRKRQAEEEFVKRRDERITNMNQQSKNIYADQYQSYYRKGGKAIQSYLKLK